MIFNTNVKILFWHVPSPLFLLARYAFVNRLWKLFFSYNVNKILNLAYVALFGILMKEILNYVWKNVYAGLRPRDPAPGCSLGINSNENRTELKWCSLIGCIGGV